MTRGYAIWRATLGPRGCRDFNIGTPSGVFGTQVSRVSVEEVSICIELSDAVASTDDLVLGEVARELDIATAESEGAINLSPLRWILLSDRPIQFAPIDGREVIPTESEVPT